MFTRGYSFQWWIFMDPIGCHFFDHGRWPISRHWLQDSKPCLRLIVLTPSILGGATRDVPATTTRFFRRLLSLPHTDLCRSESIFRYYVCWLHCFAFGSHAVWCKEIQLGLGFSLVPLVSLACPPLPYAPFRFYFFNKRIHVHPILNPLGFSGVSILCNGTVACWKKYWPFACVGATC